MKTATRKDPKAEELAGRLGMTWSEIHDVKDAGERVRSLAGEPRVVFTEAQRRALELAAHILEERAKQARAYRTVTIGPLDGGDWLVRRIGDAAAIKRTTSESYARHWAEEHGYAIHEEAN